MSFSDAVGQVDQILQWEQQLTGSAATAAATGTTAATATATDSGAATGSSTSASDTAASFAATLAQAQSTGDSALLSSTDATGTADDGTDSGLAGTGTSGDGTDAGGTDLLSSGLLSGGDSQLLSVLSSLQSGATGATGATASDPNAALITALEDALGAAGAADSSNVTATSGAAGGPAASAQDPRIQSMLAEANSLVGKPYVWGGGHSTWAPQTGYDCSGFVSAVLHAGGYLSTPQDTTSLPSSPDMQSGPGQYVTVYDRDAPGEAGHVIIEIDGQFYESGGERGSWGGGGGVEQISTPSAAYLQTFNVILHPEGL